MDTALRSSAERQLERKRYAAALAERQFNRVDPDNRLVAAELERRWQAQRKALLWCLIDKVVLDRGEHDVALVRIVWRGGAVSNIEVKMNVNAVVKLHARN